MLLHAYVYIISYTTIESILVIAYIIKNSIDIITYRFAYLISQTMLCICIRIIIMHSFYMILQINKLISILLVFFYYPSNVSIRYPLICRYAYEF